MSEHGYSLEKYPQGLGYWAKFWPTFMLVPGDVWERVTIDNSATMNMDDGVLAMNMTTHNGILTVNRGYNYDKTGVVTWASTVLH